MASTITAGTTSGTALAMSGDTSGNLDLKSGTTTVLALTATGIAVTGTLTSSGVLSATSPTFVTPVIDSATVATVSGTAPLYMCRAWVNFNGTGTVAIRASGNVSSITDNGTGDYTVNFTTAMPDADYSGVGTNSYASTDYGGSLHVFVFYTTSARFVSTLQNAASFQTWDSDCVSVSIFR